MLRDLPPNARYAVLLEPLWAVLGTATIYYGTFYMKSVGLSETSIGLIVSIHLALAFCVQLLAGTITDRLGRRRATFFFDLGCWVLPMFLWAIAADFWVFLLAYALHAGSRVPGVASRLLAAEDAEPADRSRVFGGMRLILTAAGLVIPLIGWLIGRYGAEPALRGMLVVGMCTMLAHAVSRLFLMKETEAGREAMARRPRGRIAVVAPIRVLAGAGLRPVVALVVLNGFALQLNVFQVIFLAHRGFSAAQIAALPAVAAVASLLCLRVLKDRVPPARLAGRVAFAAAFGALGWLMFVAGPPGALAPVVAGTVLAAAGLLLMDSHLDALLIDRLDDRNRAEGLSALQSITALASVPAGAVAAFLYARNPVLPFVAIVLCQAGAAALALALRPARDNPMARIVRPE